MNTLKKITLAGLLAVSFALAQQNTLVQTSLSAAITATQSQFAVASATGITAGSYSAGTAGSQLYIVDVGQALGEVAVVTGVSSTTLTVRRGASGTKAVAHASGAMVLVATAANWFYVVDPIGSCTSTSIYVTPWLNVNNGRQWVCSSVTGTWVPGWGNRSSPTAPTVLVASVGGTTAVNSPLQHVNGTNAITAWQPTVGWNGDSFCVIPDAAFTTTTGGTTVASTRVTAIAIASTAVANKTICFQYDATNSKFTASY
jgi:hypothetical protein